MKVSGNIALVVGQQSHNFIFSPPFPAGVSPTGVFANVVMPGSDAEVLAVSVDLQPDEHRSDGVAGGSPRAIARRRLHQLDRDRCAANMVTPRACFRSHRAGRRPAELSGELHAAVCRRSERDVPDRADAERQRRRACRPYSDITAYGCTVWLSGVPTSASAGGFIAWMAQGARPPPSPHRPS